MITEFMANEGLALLQASAETLYDPDLGADRARLLAVARRARALVVRNVTRVDGELLAAAPHLQVVGRLGAGLDNLDLDAVRLAGVQVVHAPGANAIATAEFTLALCLCLARDLPGAIAAASAGEWRRDSYRGRELAGRVLGVLGLGRTGTLVARLARGLGMEVWTHHPRRPADDAALRCAGVRMVAFEALLRGVDVLTLHLPLTPETRGMIGLQQLALLQPHAWLVNTARGGLVDEAALARALRERWIAGAALDVRDAEPPPDPDPLAGAPGLILTPHVAGLSAESQRLTCTCVARDVLRVLSGRVPATGGLGPSTATPAEAAAPLVEATTR